jgi:hypothetical protein
MEGLSNPEVSREVINSELIRLAEQHGLTMSELANTARKLADTEAEKKWDEEARIGQEQIVQNPHMEDFNLLKSVVGGHYEQRAGVYPVDFNWKEYMANLPQAFEAFGLAPGEKVNVERSDGTFEDDWTILSLDFDNGRAIVTKQDANTNQLLEKNIRFVDLLDQNPPGSVVSQG